MTRASCVVTAVAGRLGAWRVLVLLVVWAMGIAGAAPADGACKVNDDLADARTKWDAAHKAYLDHKLPPAIEAKVRGLAFLYDELTFDVSRADVEITPEELAAMKAFVTERAKRKAALDTAVQAVLSAQRAWNKAFTAKEAAMDEASKAFEAEQSHIRSERAELAKMKVNSKEYLDRASTLLERLKKSYAQIIAKVSPYRDCFEDVETFLKDIDGRLVRIGEEEAKIVELRRKNGEVVAAVPPGAGPVAAEPGDPKQDPLGDTWVLKAGHPAFRPEGGKFERCDGTGFNYVIEAGGVRHVGEMTVVKGPPARIRVNELVELTMTVKGSDPRVIWPEAKWASDNFTDNVIAKGNVSCSITNPNLTPTATYRCYFRPTDGPNAVSRLYFYGGQFGAAPWGAVTWEYEKAK